MIKFGLESYRGVNKAKLHRAFMIISISVCTWMEESSQSASGLHWSPANADILECFVTLIPKNNKLPESIKLWKNAHL